MKSKKCLFWIDFGFKIFILNPILRYYLILLFWIQGHWTIPISRKSISDFLIPIFRHKSSLILWLQKVPYKAHFHHILSFISNNPIKILSHWNFSKSQFSRILHLLPMRHLVKYSNYDSLQQRSFIYQYIFI